MISNSTIRHLRSETRGGRTGTAGDAWSERTSLKAGQELLVFRCWRKAVEKPSLGRESAANEFGSESRGEEEEEEDPWKGSFC